MSINEELSKLEEKIESPVELQEVLEKLDISCHATHTCVYLDYCPKCEGEKTLYIRAKDNKEEFSIYKWRCYKCEAHLKSYDSLVGLLRLFRPELSPFLALNALIDVISKPEGECLTILTFGKYAGKQVDKIPPSYLIFLVEKTSCLSDNLRTEIEDYLYGIGEEYLVKF